MSGISTGLNLDARKFLQLSSGLIMLPSRPITALCVHDKSVDSAVCDIAYLPSIPGFLGLSRVSASPPGIPELVLSIPDYPGFQRLLPVSRN